MADPKSAALPLGDAPTAFANYQLGSVQWTANSSGTVPGGATVDLTGLACRRSSASTRRGQGRNIGRPSLLVSSATRSGAAAERAAAGRPGSGEGRAAGKPGPP